MMFCEVALWFVVLLLNVDIQSKRGMEPSESPVYLKLWANSLKQLLN
jgi:hypothetical protein